MLSPSFQNNEIAHQTLSLFAVALSERCSYLDLTTLKGAFLDH